MKGLILARIQHTRGPSNPESALSGANVVMRVKSHRHSKLCSMSSETGELDRTRIRLETVEMAISINNNAVLHVKTYKSRR